MFLRSALISTLECLMWTDCLRSTTAPSNESQQKDIIRSILILQQEQQQQSLLKGQLQQPKTVVESSRDISNPVENLEECDLSSTSRRDEEDHDRLEKVTAGGKDPGPGGPSAVVGHSPHSESNSSRYVHRAKSSISRYVHRVKSSSVVSKKNRQQRRR